MILVINTKIETKRREIEKLQDNTKKIKAARTKLENEGAKDLAIFNSNINMLGMVWQAARNDAHKVQQWLKDGAEDAVCYVASYEYKAY
jgi:prophage antirepressor-like protein